MAAEQREFPPAGVEYVFTAPLPGEPRVVTSPIKGYMRRFDTTGIDILEAIISPTITDIPWVYSLATYDEAVAFGFFGLPTPRPIRNAYMHRLFRRDNFKKLLFWSHAGRNAMRDYGADAPWLIEKSAVVYPAVRRVPDERLSRPAHDLTLLFNGDFFRKGGVNVVDAFERAQPRYPGLRLRLCCDERDFNTGDAALKREYLEKVQRNPHITLGRATRQEMMGSIFPGAAIYLLPTYMEAFGFAILEAMAFGIPVIATNHFAIPEIIDDGVTGLLVDTSQYDANRLFRGYVVNHIPPDFRELVTEGVYSRLCMLIESPERRTALGAAALHVVRDRFSFERRNQAVAGIYQEALR